MDKVRSLKQKRAEKYGYIVTPETRVELPQHVRESSARVIERARNQRRSSTNNLAKKLKSLY